MNIHIPSEVIGAFWTFIATLLTGLTGLLVMIKHPKIPLSWGNKMPHVGECITKEELRDHCAKRQLALDVKIETINSSIAKLGDILVEIRERVAKIEGSLGQ